MIPILQTNSRKVNHLSPSFTICKFKYQNVTGIGAIMAVSTLKEHFELSSLQVMKCSKFLM